MNNVINIKSARATPKCTLSCCNCTGGGARLDNKTAEDVSMSIYMEQIMAELEEETSWTKNLDVIPEHLRTGDHETDVAGIALSMDRLGQAVTVDLGAFALSLDFFNRQLMTLDEGQRERVLSRLDKPTATALLLLEYSEKLKAAELAPMVDAALKARA